MHEDAELTLLFIDFDHANERYAEITVDPVELRMDLERRIETNADYLSAGTDPEEDWSEEVTLHFENAEDLRKLVFGLADRLLDRCFAYLDDDHIEVDDSDDAREDIERRLAEPDYGEVATTTDTVKPEDFEARLAALLAYPR